MNKFYKHLCVCNFLVKLNFIRMSNYFFPNLKINQSIGRLLYNHLICLGPAFIKAGQMMSFRYDIFPEDFLFELQSLLCDVPDDDEYDYLILRKYPEIENLKKIGSGTIAQLFRGIYKDREYAIKIKKPNIDTELRQGIEVLEFWVWLLGIVFYPQLKLAERFRFFKESVLVQSNFKKEIANMEKFRKYTKNCKHIKVPKVYHDLSDNDIIFMQYIKGDTLDKKKDINFSQVKTEFITFSFKPLLIEDIVHGDLHPGNIIIDSEQNLWILDFGLVYDIDPELTAQFFLYLKYLTNLNSEKLVNWILENYVCDKPSTAFTETITKIFRDEFKKDEPILTDTCYKVINLIRKNNYHLNEQFAQLEITKLNYFGVIKILNSNAKNTFDALQNLQI